MSADDNTISETIERYVQGKMQGQEKIAFEQSMLQDANLNALVEKQKVMYALLIEAGLHDIRAMVQNDLSKQKRSVRNKWIGGGLMLVALTSIGLYTLSLQQSPTNSTITTQSKSLSNTNTSANNSSEGSNERISPLIHKNQTPSKVDNVGKTNEIIAPTSNELPNTKNTEIPTIDLETRKPISNLKVDSEIAKSNPCNDFKPTYALKIEPSYILENTGKIIITKKEQNLSFTLTTGKNPSFGNLFDNLEPGTYSLRIENKEGCQFTENNIRVGVTNCIVLEKELFNASTDNVYRIPTSKEEISSVHIYDKKMNEIRTFTKGESLEWDGRNRDGQVAESGLYRIELLYSNGERCSVTLTFFN